MTRIIAGAAGGRRLAVPPAGTRPTSDRVRESMFATLESMLLREGRGWEGLRVADLFAGSGALGFEAASRGASSVVLVERARGALAVLRSNAEALGLAGCAVAAADAAAWCRAPRGPFDLVLVDPPYDLPSGEVAVLLTALAPSLAPGAVIVVERRAGDPCPLPGGFEADERRYGDTVLWYGREQS